MEQAFNWKRLLITVTYVVITALVIGGTVWYFMDQQAKEDAEEYQKQIAAAERQKESGGGEKDETESWKIYTSKKYGFTIKYPTDWTVSENESTSSGKEYWGGNVFSENNVIFKNAKEKVGIGLNMGEILGRGGTCTRRIVNYKGTVKEKKLVLVRQTDNYNLELGENEMCGGENLTGYSVNGTFSNNSVNYFFHSESTTASDDLGKAIVKIYEKMAATMSFK